MNVSIKGGKPATAAAISRLEAEIGRALSPAFKAFIAARDGAEPEDNIFDVDNGDNNAGVDEFIPVADILEWRPYIDGIPAHAYPVAHASGGNYVVIDEGRGGLVFFWDHEFPEKMVKLADDFAQFLALLTPFDIDSVELDPKDVISAWIDPDFLKSLKG